MKRLAIAAVGGSWWDAAKLTRAELREQLLWAWMEAEPVADAREGR